MILYITKWISSYRAYPLLQFSKYVMSFTNSSHCTHSSLHMSFHNLFDRQTPTHPLKPSLNGTFFFFISPHSPFCPWFENYVLFPLFFLVVNLEISPWIFNIKNINLISISTFLPPNVRSNALI